MTGLVEGQLEDGTPTRLAVQCRRCGNWLVSAASVDRRLGPTCARHGMTQARIEAEHYPLFEVSDA
ncbi:DUF6011 domain-containing protein [Nocardia sp. SC052]|uniref:DUF6011 domain-containing protein n=1 Tax=Nocardia sichangensis TaxID=3385975 RepID=UPI0039A21658